MSASENADTGGSVQRNATIFLYRTAILVAYQFVAGLVISKYVASVDGLGYYTSVRTATVLVNAIASLGLERYFAVALARVPIRPDGRRWFGVQTLWSLVRAGCALGFCQLWAFVVLDDPWVALALNLGFVALYFGAMVRSEFFDGLGRPEVGAAMLTASAAVHLLLLGVVISQLGELELWDLALIQLTTASVAIVVTRSLIRHRFPWTVGSLAAAVRDPDSELGGVIKRSLPFLPLPLLAFIYQESDVLLLAAMSTLDEVAHYRIGYLIVANATLGYTVFALAYRPKLSRLAGSDEDGFRELLERFAIRAFLGSAVGLIFSVAIAPAFVAWWFPQYSPCLPLVPILAGGYFLYFMPPYSEAFYAKLRPRFIVRASIATAALNIVLNLVLIGRYGALGAASATAGSFFVLRLIYIGGYAFALRLPWLTVGVGSVLVVGAAGIAGLTWWLY